MCGRFTLTVADFDVLLAAVDATVEPERRPALAELPLPRFNIAPMQEHWIVCGEGEARGIERATWGLVNWWAESRREGAKQINARAETVAQRRPFREAFAQRRCAVPADGFFEWTVNGRERKPWWFHRPDDQVFLFAGLYEVARLRGEPEPVTTFTILTTTPNALIEPVHDRMPVVLPDQEAVDHWLWSGQSTEQLRELLRPVDERYFVQTPASTRVNSVQNDDPACLNEGDSETQGALL
jgi:putative SOS response-associated peptidase YedK